MYVDVNGMVYAFKFLYLDSKLIGQVDLTLCKVYRLKEDAESWEGLAIGVARCANGDQFDRVVGRKIALRRALSYVFTDNSDARALVWEAYRATHKLHHGDTRFKKGASNEKE